jgi:hypothetical protein
MEVIGDFVVRDLPLGDVFPANILAPVNATFGTDAAFLSTP